MIQNAQRLVDRVRRYVQDPVGVQQGNTFTDADIVDFLNEEQDDLIAAMVAGSEDYFGVSKDLAFQAGVNVYPLFGGLLTLRRVQYLGGDQASQVNPTDMIESRMVEGSDSIGGTATPDQAQYFYSVYCDDFNIAPTPQSDVSSPAARMYFIRDPGPILLETLTSGGIVSASQAKLTSVDAPLEDDIMVGTYLHIVSGTGVGQRRKITAYAGSTKQVTVDSPTSPPWDNTSKIATESRIVRMFHHLLALGAAKRAKTSVEESTKSIDGLYFKSMDRFEDFVYKARTGGQRALQVVDFDVI